MQMEMFMKEIGLMIKQMEKEFTPTWMELDTLESGKWTNNMDEDKKYGQIMLLMKGSINMGRNMGKEYLNGQMELLIMENFKRIT